MMPCLKKRRRYSGEPAITHGLFFFICFQQALAEKEKGNAAYKKKNFVSALDHYNKAVEFDPTDMTYLTNLAAVYFEQKDFMKCVEMCTRAIDVGRENRADFKLIAKAYTRIGNSYKKLKVDILEFKNNFVFKCNQRYKFIIG